VEPLVGLGKSGKSGAAGFDELAAAKDAARRVTVMMIVKSEPIPTNVELAKRWGVSKAWVSGWRRDFIKEGYEIPVTFIRSGASTTRPSGARSTIT
jgi:hypothetical protein